jgi:hypothetical protein
MIIEVKQRLALLVLGGVTLDSTAGAVGRCTRIEWIGQGRLGCGIPHVKGYNSTPRFCYSKEYMF